MSRLIVSRYRSPVEMVVAINIGVIMAAVVGHTDQLCPHRHHLARAAVTSGVDGDSGAAQVALVPRMLGHILENGFCV